MKPTSLYRFYDERGVLLYVGITDWLPLRLGDHNREKPWWVSVASVRVEHHPTRSLAEAAERDAIVAELPFWNIVHQPTVSEVRRVLAMNPALAAIFAEVRQMTRWWVDDREYDPDEEWYYGGLRERALWALRGDGDPPMRMDAWHEDAVDYRHLPLANVVTMADFLDAGETESLSVHEEWMADQWGPVARALLDLMPPRDAKRGWVAIYDFDEPGF